MNKNINSINPYLEREAKNFLNDFLNNKESMNPHWQEINSSVSKVSLEMNFDEIANHLNRKKLTKYLNSQFPDQLFKKLKNKNFKIQGSGNEIRSFIYIEDFVNAFNLILNRGRHLGIYNIGTNEKIKIKNLAYKLSKIMKKKILIKKSPLRKGSTKIRIPDIKKIKKLGFEAKFNLNKGLKKTLDLKRY